MSGYWDALQMQPQMIQAGISAGNSVANAFALAAATKRQNRAQDAEMAARQQAADRQNDLQVAQREAAQGRPDIMLSAFPAEYQAQQVAAEDRQRAIRSAQISDASKMQQMRELNPLVYEIAAQYKLGRGDEEAILADPRVGRDIQQHFRAGLEGRSKGSGNIFMPGGGTAMPTGAVTTAINEVRGIDQQIKMLDNMGAAIKNAGGHQQLSSIPEAGKAAWSGFISRLNSNLVSPEDVKKFGARGAAVAEVATFRNMIFNKLSGAAVSESEMKRLMESVPDVVDPWYVREAKMRSWDNNLRMSRDAGYDDITQGIKAMSGKMSVDWSKNAQAQNQAQQPAAVQTTPGPIDAQEEKYLELRRQGVPADQAQQQAWGQR